MKIWITEIKRPVPRLIRQVAIRLRESDANEILGTSGILRSGLTEHLVNDVSETLHAAGRAWMVFMNHTPIAIFGVRPNSLTSDEAGLWMLATKNADRIPHTFARWSRLLLSMAWDSFPMINEFYNFVPQRSTRTIEWLRWLGAWMSTSQFSYTSPWTGDLFQRFVISREALNV